MIEDAQGARGARDVADEYCIPFEVVVANVRAGFWNGHQDSLGNWWVAGTAVRGLKAERNYARARQSVAATLASASFTGSTDELEMRTLLNNAYRANGLLTQADIDEERRILTERSAAQLKNLR